MATSYDDYVRFNILSNKFRTNRNKNVIVKNGGVVLNYALPLHSCYVGQWFKDECQYGLNICTNKNKIVKFNTSIPWKNIKHLLYRNKHGIYFLNHIAFGKIRVKESHIGYILNELGGRYNDRTIVKFIRKSYTNGHITQFRLQTNWQAPQPKPAMSINSRIVTIRAQPPLLHPPSVDTRTGSARLGPGFDNPEKLTSRVPFVEKMLNAAPKQYAHVPPPKIYHKFELNRIISKRITIDRLVVAIINLAITLLITTKQAVMTFKSVFQTIRSILSIPSRIICLMLPYRPSSRPVKKVHTTKTIHLSLTSPYIIDQVTKVPVHAMATQTDKFMMAKHPEMATQTETTTIVERTQVLPRIFSLVLIISVTLILRHYLM